MPVSETICGLPVASSVIVMLPVRVPAAVGVKATLNVHDAPGFTVLPQLLVWAKSPAVAMLVMINGPLPVFFSVAGWAGSPYRLRGKSQASRRQADRGDASSAG